MDNRWRIFRLLALIAYCAVLSSALVLIFFIGPHGTRSRIILASIVGIAGIVVIVFGAALLRRARFRRALRQLGGINMALEKCPYCGRDYPVRDDIERCPTCGGDLKPHRTALARNEKKFSMDGENDTGIG